MFTENVFLLFVYYYLLSAKISDLTLQYMLVVTAALNILMVMFRHWQHYMLGKDSGFGFIQKVSSDLNCEIQCVNKILKFN